MAAGTPTTNPDPAPHGLIVYRASRLEALLEPLSRLMDAAPPERILAPHGVIAAHPGMQRWLSRELARRAGVRGIVANLRIELPSAWLDRLALEVLGAEAVALRPYRREVLRWRIHDCLGAIDDARVAAYLGADAGGRALRRFQLADRLARIYTRYLVYRPDWLREWAAGRDPTGRAGFLFPLWKMLQSRIGLPHRGELLGRLVERLARAAAPSSTEPLHVFGLSHLAPPEFAVLRAVARRRPVVLYVPDPCREYWGGLRDDLARLRELAREGADAAEAEGAFLAQPHPLLARWGRMGQHFLLALDEAGASIDVRHWQDEADAATPATRLARLQESIRRLDPDAAAGGGGDAGTERADASLRVHVCHTRLRELEALRDALLQARKADSSLKPSDIVVMMPDVHAYLPLLASVFGAAGRHEGPLPYHCFDVAVARSHALFAAFRRLLDLPQSRLTAPEVVDLLAVPPIARRLGIGADDADVIAGWLRDGRVAWALDAAFRARFDVPPIAAHTFAWGIDRLLAGHVFGAADGDEPQAVVLADGERVVPVAGVHGPQAALIGALDTLLIELGAWCAAAHAPRRASEWAAWLEQRLEALFAIDPTDREAREAKALVLRFIRLLESEPDESGLDPPLDFAVVRDILLARVDAAPERQRFLLGGVTFCGMVPQRAIPFRIVAVLGLNDGEYPRAGGDAGLDLMNTVRRLGDRDVRSDDRYLFLETIMSARSALHLSYVGEGVRDGEPRNPAAPLAELLAFLDAGTAQARAGAAVPAPHSDEERRRWPWLVRHPLQPFDERYFDRRDPALFSFRADFAAMRGDGAESAPPFVDDDAPDFGAATAPPDGDAAQAVALGEVLAYFRNPAKQLLAGALNLRLDALSDDRLRDSEPLDARADAIDQVARRLFLDAAARPAPVLPDIAPDWLRLSGALPPGRIGQDAWRAERDKAAALVDAARGHALFAGGLPRARPTLIDRIIDAGEPGRFAVHGELRRVYERDGTLWLMELFANRAAESGLDFKARIGFFLEWALLRLGEPPTQPVRACLVVPGERDDGLSERFARWERAFADAPAQQPALLRDLERRVGALLAFWARSQRQPQWYFPATSWAALDGPADAKKRWLGDRFGARGERDYEPGYARLLAGEREFGGDDFAPLRANAERLCALIDLGNPWAAP